MIKVDVFTEGAIKLPYKTIDKKLIRKNAENILELKKTDNVRINIILSDNESIRNVNDTYRGRNYPTDVISFAYREDPFPSHNSGPEELGDIYISMEKAFEQSVEFGSTFREEIMRLLVHGILHLLGYDHERSEHDAGIMESEEESILNSL